MSLILFNLWGQLRGWIIGAGVVALAILTIYGKGRSDGKSKAVEDDRKELRKDVQTKKKLENDVANDSPDELDKRLRRWVKD